MLNLLIFILVPSICIENLPLELRKLNQASIHILQQKCRKKSTLLKPHINISGTVHFVTPYALINIKKGVLLIMNCHLVYLSLYKLKWTLLTKTKIYRMIFNSYKDELNNFLFMQYLPKYELNNTI